MTEKTTSDSNTAHRAQPESFRARSLNASLTVNDLAKSIVWYRDAIGFTVEREHERNGKVVAASLRAGSIQILLGQDDGAKGMDRVKGTGFSLQFTTAQNIDDLANRIKAYGTALESEPMDMPWGARVFRVVDPDGFKLVFSSERP
jgi:lactoylglutathione lyase